MGPNIPEKPVEVLCYFGKIPRYQEMCEEVSNIRFWNSFESHSLPISS